jgi:BTB/POZ domain-containing protein KCTD9
MSEPDHEQCIEHTDSPPPPNEDPITLQVGERRFVTYESTLRTESEWFDGFLSPRWRQAQEDGSFFIDADASLFEHILRYLRSGTFPVFYDSAKGHDYSVYLALQHEAAYFQIPRLENWLQSKGYLEVFKVRYATESWERASLEMGVYAGEEEIEFRPT